MVNSIQKGKAFEREVANLLTKITGKPWHRVPQSGAGATAQHIKAEEFMGDVFCEDEPYKSWCVECKISGKKVLLGDLFHPKSLLAGWWNQTINECKGSMPVLIFKYSASPIFIMSGMPLEGMPPPKGFQRLHFFIREDMEAIVMFGVLEEKTKEV